MPLRRAVSRVKFLPDTQAWAAAQHKDGVVVRYVLSLDHDRHQHGRCYWTVEARPQHPQRRRPANSSSAAQSHSVSASHGWSTLKA